MMNNNSNRNKGYNEYTGLWNSRYYAKKNCPEGSRVVKVYGGYQIMTESEYKTWKNQK